MIIEHMLRLFTFCILMDFPIHSDTISMGLTSLYLTESTVEAF